MRPVDPTTWLLWFVQVDHLYLRRFRVSGRGSWCLLLVWIHLKRQINIALQLFLLITWSTSRIPFPSRIQFLLLQWFSADNMTFFFSPVSPDCYFFFLPTLTLCFFFLGRDCIRNLVFLHWWVRLWKCHKLLSLRNLLLLLSHRWKCSKLGMLWQRSCRLFYTSLVRIRLESKLWHSSLIFYLLLSLTCFSWWCKLGLIEAQSYLLRRLFLGYLFDFTFFRLFLILSNQSLVGLEGQSLDFIFHCFFGYLCLLFLELISMFVKAVVDCTASWFLVVLRLFVYYFSFLYFCWCSNWIWPVLENL